MSALNKQVAGGHYKALAIQPIEYIHANSIPFAEGSVIKYVTRWRDKGGVADLEKAKHFLELLIELETKAAPAADWPDEARRQDEAAEAEAWKAIEARMDVIGSNGNDGEHYAVAGE